MNKEIYIIGGHDIESYTTFRDRMVATASEIAEFYHPEKVWVTLTEATPPRVSVIPFKRNKIAAISVVRKDWDDKPYPMLTGLAGYRFRALVQEALPVSYTKTWPDGQITPGVCLLTLFRRKPGISLDTFLDRWHNSHTPLSLRIHPLWHYNRNVVLETFSPLEADWGGVVEEHFTSRGKLTNPFRFFGNPLVIIPRMIEVWVDTKSFLDYNTIETYLAREYHIKS
jgi:hypothetical protein